MEHHGISHFLFVRGLTAIYLLCVLSIDVQLNDLHVTSFLGLYKEDVYQL